MEAGAREGNRDGADRHDRPAPLDAEQLLLLRFKLVGREQSVIT